MEIILQSKFNKINEENITMTEVGKMLGILDFLTQRLMREGNIIQCRSAKLKTSASLFHLCVSAAILGNSFVTLFFGSYLIYSDLMNIGAFVAYFSLIGKLSSAVSRCTGHMRKLQCGTSSLADLLLLLNLPVELFSQMALQHQLRQAGCETEKTGLTKEASSGIVLEGVVFQYTVQGQIIIDIPTLWIPGRGNLVACVGRSGQGKTTLLGLLTRLYVPLL